METEGEELSSYKLKLLVQTRLDMENEFASGRTKRGVLWGKVLNEIKKEIPELKMTREQISRKFLNLLTTYKRIKERIYSTGKNTTCWEFFDDFDEVYGIRNSKTPPLENIQSSLEITFAPDNIKTESIFIEEDDENIKTDSLFIEEEDENTKTDSIFIDEDDFEVPVCTRYTKRQRLTSTGNMEEREEAEKEQLRNNEVFYLEQEKLAEREKEPMETEGEESYKLKLLVQIRLGMQSEFTSGRTKRGVLWGKVLDEIKKEIPEFEMTREQISRKFLNLLSTYKRIKDRINSTGKNTTCWEFFDDFDEVYGIRHSKTPPLDNLQSSLQITFAPENIKTESIFMDEEDENIKTDSIFIDEDDENTKTESIFIDEEDFEEPAYTKYAKRQDKTRLRSSDNMVEFLREEAKKDQLRHREVLNLEREKLAEREKEPVFSKYAKKQKLTSSDDMLEFLKEESKKEQLRHNEVIKLEREKLAVEKARVYALAEIKNLIQKFLQK